MKHIEIINGPNLTQLRQICNLAQKIKPKSVIRPTFIPFLAF